MRRLRPRQHLRRLKTGRRIIVNKGVKRVASRIYKKLRPYSTRIDIAGSIRRKENPRDVDIVLIPKDKEKIKSVMGELGNVKSEGDKQIFTDVDGVQVDLYFAEPDNYGAQLMSRTGPAGSNIYNRVIAKEKGMVLNQYGLWKGKRRVASKTEKEIYQALGKPYRLPEERGLPRENIHPQQIGSSWKGDMYIHGPRKHEPSRYSEFRLGKPMQSGKRLVWGRVKGTDSWEIQSVLRPKKPKSINIKKSKKGNDWMPKVFGLGMD